MIVYLSERHMQASLTVKSCLKIHQSNEGNRNYYLGRDYGSKVAILETQCEYDTAKVKAGSVVTAMTIFVVYNNLRFTSRGVIE